MELLTTDQKARSSNLFGRTTKNKGQSGPSLGSPALTFCCSSLRRIRSGCSARQVCSVNPGTGLPAEQICQTSRGAALHLSPWQKVDVVLVAHAEGPADPFGGVVPAASDQPAFLVAGQVHPVPRQVCEYEFSCAAPGCTADRQGHLVIAVGHQAVAGHRSGSSAYGCADIHGEHREIAAGVTEHPTPHTVDLQRPAATSRT